MSLRQLTQVAARRFSTTVRRSKDEITSGYPELKKKQELFQKENGLPVHLKGGGVDGLLYRGTWIACGVGLATSFVLYYNLIRGNK